MSLLPQWSATPVPVIGMLHLPPLPGSSRWAGDLEAVRDFVLHDAESLCAGGVDGLMIENFGDTPFYPDRVPAITVAAMTALACEVRRRFDVPLGINVLRNDGRSALAVAVASGASFIRVNVLCGARVTDQGLLQGIAHDLLRERAFLKSAEAIRILADVDVKHSAPLAARPFEVEVSDVIHRGHADAIIVSGAATGSATDIQTLSAAKQSAGATPVLIGSGVSAETVPELIAHGADGLIVGTSLKFDGRISNPVDPQRVRSLVEAVRRARAAT